MQQSTVIESGDGPQVEASGKEEMREKRGGRLGWRGRWLKLTLPRKRGENVARGEGEGREEGERRKKREERKKKKGKREKKKR